jgi:H+-transporting ATPase
LLLNAGVGFWQEFKADTAIAALKERLALVAHVLRGERWRDCPDQAGQQLDNSRLAELLPWTWTPDAS